VILHITSRASWEQARAPGTYRAESLATEGFIHCSGWDQLAGTVSRHYEGASDLVVLVVDPSGLDVRVENGFPHLYSELPASSVAEVLTLPEALSRAAAR
jgi:uncharacterized protein (DUF952 family)